MTEVLEHTAVSSAFDRDDRLFDHFAASCEDQFTRVAPGNTPLFTVETSEDLFDVYLEAFPPSERQHHNCNCCRQFIRRFGNLVVINEAGETESAIWNPATVPYRFRPVAEALEHTVRRGKVDGIFVSKEKVWGTPITGEWHHFAVRPAAARVHRDRLYEPHQVMAQKKQDFGTLSHGLADYGRDVVRQALNLLETDSLYRSEKVIGPANFLFNLHNVRANTRNTVHRHNLIWKAVATAPVGFCTPRSSMIGTLLDDLKTDMDFDLVRRRFAEKMDPLQYRRPQAPASAGNIEQAEKLVGKLGIANSLRRRFARIEEVKLLWSPKDDAPVSAEGGVFGHLKQSASRKSEASTPAQKITWVKFASTVLPKAKKISAYVSGRMNFAGVLTAVDLDAPPIIQWDHEDNRNPFSWYVYHGGSTPSNWGLLGNTFVNVTGVMLNPHMWSDEVVNSNFPNRALFILEGARDVRGATACLFPEILKADLHPIRATIEAYSKSSKAEGAEDGTANGLLLGDNSGATTIIRVTTDLGVAHYRIDRWD